MNASARAGRASTVRDTTPALWTLRVTADPALRCRARGGTIFSVSEAESTTPAASVRDPASGITLPSRLVFRIPASSLVGVVFLAMCASFVAAASPWLTTVYIAPFAIAVWVIRTRTVVDAEKVVVRRVLTQTELPWSAIKALRVADRKWVRAVRTDGGEVVLPTVRTRHLPALSLISGGRIPDPTA